MWITIDAVCIDSPLCAKLNTNGELPKLLSQPWMNNFYAVFLIEQSKLKESKYNAYLKSLPLDMSNYPTLLSQSDRELLKGCAINSKIDNSLSVIRKDYDILCQTAPELAQSITIEDFTRGVILASQRAYDLTYTDGSIRQVLIPYIDVSPINYGKPQNVKCYQKDGFLQLVSSAPIQRGETIVQAQSRACNSSVFIKSGFIADDNEKNNTIPIDVGLDTSDPNFKVKLELISQPEPYQNFILTKSFTVKSTCEFFSWCRYITYNEDQAFLVLAKTQALQEANTKMKARGATPE